MQFDIIQGRDEVREIRNRDREILAFSQECYFLLPDSAFPVRGKIRVVKRLPPGTYEFDPVYRIGRYGDLEINPFEAPLVAPVKNSGG